MSVTLVENGNTLTLPNPAHQGRVRAIPHQAVGLTAGGTRYVYDKGVTLYQITLTFQLVTEAEYSAFMTFYTSTVDESLTTFTYTDSKGNAYALTRFIGEPRVTKRMSNVFDLTFTLETATKPL